jgi:hypothetical protein
MLKVVDKEGVVVEEISSIEKKPPKMGTSSSHL